MRVVIFCHSLVSDWNNGHAHFQRGITRELVSRGHDVRVLEPRDAWSRRQLLASHGAGPIRDFHRAYPELRSRTYDPREPRLAERLEDADLVIVSEWTETSLVRSIGEHRRRFGGYRLFFNDAHHRSATEPEAMAAYDLSGYDGVLAFGRGVRDRYLEKGWARRAWIWYEAADHHLFRPLDGTERRGDLVWIGNWGDEERTEELEEFLLEPARRLGLRTRVYGVRYPEEALDRLARADIEYMGWLPNHRVPRVFAEHAVTVHIPRRPYLESLPGIPTIRPFEALACGIPLVSARWSDRDGLFRVGEDFRVARDGAEMRRHLAEILGDGTLADRMAASGRETILARHTCAHRVDQLLAIHAELEREAAAAATS